MQKTRCSEDTLSTTPLPNAQAISETARQADEIEKVRRQNTKLSGEIAILRSNMLLLERDNYALRTEKSKGLVSELSKLEQVKKEMKMLVTENRIKDNQLRAFKRTKPSDPGLEIDTKWALEMIDPHYQLTLYPFKYDRLKKLHDFFYEDFKMMLSTDVVVKEMKRVKTNFGDFINFFLIFCCKKDVFEYFVVDLFCEYGFEDNSMYRKQMFRVLKYLPVEWISAFFTNEKFVVALNEFLEENIESNDAVLFYLRVVENRPFLLSFILSTRLFTTILHRGDAYSNSLLKAMADKNLASFIDYKNICLIPREYLRMFYKEDYIDLGYR